VREWAGGVCHVTALTDGYAWNGTTYRSLSQVARAITGTRWNGRRFFGLARRNGTSTRKSNNNKCAGTDQRPSVKGADPS
jgi:hypothetical protein